MKQDEIDFLIAVYSKSKDETVRDLIKRGSLPAKRCWYLLEKWSNKGWYNYGVTVDLGWLEDEGKEIAKCLLDQ